MNLRDKKHSTNRSISKEELYDLLLPQSVTPFPSTAPSTSTAVSVPTPVLQATVDDNALKCIWKSPSFERFTSEKLRLEFRPRLAQFQQYEQNSATNISSLFDCHKITTTALARNKNSKYNKMYCSKSVQPKNLISSIRNGELDEVREYIELMDVDVNREINGRHLLHYAADYGHQDIIEYLLSRGANVDAEDCYGVRPLLVTIWEGHTKCVELFLSHGACKKGLTPDGKSYVEAAEKDEIRKLLT